VKEQETSPQQDAQKGSARKRRNRQNSVVHYVAILFAAAFLLMLVTYAMERRKNIEMDDKYQDLTQSITGLNQSAMQSVQSTLEQNAALQEEVGALEALTVQLEEELRERTLQLEQTQGALEYSQQALDWFWQINEAYVRGRYTTARALIAQMKNQNLAECLPKESATGNGRFSPYDRYQEICTALG